MSASKKGAKIPFTFLAFSRILLKNSVSAIARRLARSLLSKDF